MTGECSANLIPEYGVIHLQNALREEEQKALWKKTKPKVKNPKGKMTGFSAFAVSSGKSDRDQDFDRFGELLFTRTAAELMKQMTADDCKNEPSYKRLSETHKPFRNERSGPGRTFIMKSGDAVFFDGGSIPHEVNRILPGTAPAWWEKAKVPNGARCVVLFREDMQ